MKYICPLPWLHLSAHYDGSLRVCCNGGEGREILSDSNEPIYLNQLVDTNEYINSPTLKNIRKEMMQNITPKMCHTCHATDLSGGESPGKIYSKQFQRPLLDLLDRTRDDGTLDSTQKPQYVDFTFGNICNLQCRMCAPEFSTSLYKEWNLLNLPYDVDGEKRARKNWKDSEKFQVFLNDITKNSNILLLQGGEPLVNNQLINILRFLVNKGHAKDIFLKINTNLTKLPKDVVNLLINFKGIAFHISLEAWGDRNDYIRYPSKFNEILTNLKKLIKLKKVIPLYINIVTVFQTMNISDIVEMLENLKRFAKDLPPIPRFNYLNWPEYLAAHHMPQPAKENAIKEIVNYLKINEKFYETCGEVTISNYKSLLSCIELAKNKGSDKLFQEYLDFSAKLDNSRSKKGDS